MSKNKKKSKEKKFLKKKFQKKTRECEFCHLKKASKQNFLCFNKKTKDSSYIIFTFDYETGLNVSILDLMAIIPITFEMNQLTIENPQEKNSNFFLTGLISQNKENLEENSCFFVRNYIENEVLFNEFVKITDKVTIPGFSFFAILQEIVKLQHKVLVLLYVQ